MEASYHRHDISDKVWSLLEPHLPGQRGQWGGIAQDNRRFINAVFWVLRTGHSGGTCLRITGSGAAFIKDSSDGAEKVYGKNFWKF
jgi:transposase